VRIHLFAIDHGFAISGDRVGIIECDRQGVHVGLFLGVDAAGPVEVKADAIAV